MIEAHLVKVYDLWEYILEKSGSLAIALYWNRHLLPCIPAHFDSSCAHGIVSILKASVAMLEPSLAQQNSHKRLMCIICQWEVGYLASVTLLINPTFVWVSHKVSGTAPKDLRSNIISQTKVCEHSIQKFFTVVSPKYVFSTNKQQTNKKWNYMLYILHNKKAFCCVMVSCNN